MTKKYIYSNSNNPLGILPTIDKPYFPFKSNIYETKVPIIIFFILKFILKKILENNTKIQRKNYHNQLRWYGNISELFFVFFIYKNLYNYQKHYANY